MCSESVAIETGLAEMAASFKAKLVMQLNAIRALLSTMSADDNRFQGLMEERTEILKLINPE